MGRLPIPPWMLRVLRIALVATLAWMAFRWLEPRGYGWAVLVGAGVLGVLFIGWRATRIVRARAQDARAERWAEALMDPARRPDAVAELRAARETTPPDRDAREHARLSLVLAELLEADGHPEDALAALAEVRTSALTDAYAAVVHHARAVSALSAGDVDAAEEALAAIDGPVGDRVVDLRVRLMRGVLAVERRRPSEAREIADDVLDLADGDRDLATEARVLRALAFDAEGDDEAATRAMHRLGDDMLEVLEILGLPRVRVLARRARSAEEP